MKLMKLNVGRKKKGTFTYLRLKVIRRENSVSRDTVNDSMKRFDSNSDLSRIRTASPV